MICLAMRSAFGDGCACAAAGPANPSIANAANAAMTRRFEKRTYIGALPPCLRSGPLDEPHPVRTGNDSSPSEADEQAVFHDSRDHSKPCRKSLRVWNALQLGVQNPVAAIRDESMAVWPFAHYCSPGATGSGSCSFDRQPGRLGAKWHDLDRQRKPAKLKNAFGFVGNHQHRG